jgi:hypothetical protein
MMYESGRAVDEAQINGFLEAAEFRHHVDLA